MLAMVAAMAILAVGALVIMQVSIAYNGNQNQARVSRLKGNTHLLLLNIAQRIKRGHDLATFNPACTGFGTTLRVKTLPGHTAADPKLLCLQDDTQVCTTNPELAGGDPRPVCAPLTNAKMDWQIDARDTGGPATFGTLTVGTPSYSLTANSTRITIPDRTDPLWKDCNGNTCVRLSLCPPGLSTCTDNQVLGAQTIMLTNN